MGQELSGMEIAEKFQERKKEIKRRQEEEKKEREKRRKSQYEVRGKMLTKCGWLTGLKVLSFFLFLSLFSHSFLLFSLPFFFLFLLSLFFSLKIHGPPDGTLTFTTLTLSRNKTRNGTNKRKKGTRERKKKERERKKKKMVM